jgi:hypothetical protein
MRTLVVPILVLLLASASYSKERNKSTGQVPIAWGLLSQNKGCVIFREYRKTRGMIWGVAVTTKTQSELEVIESHNYNLEKKKWVEKPKDGNELIKFAVKDRIKFVNLAR